MDWQSLLEKYRSQLGWLALAGVALLAVKKDNKWPPDPPINYGGQPDPNDRDADKNRIIKWNFEGKQVKPSRILGNQCSTFTLANPQVTVLNVWKQAFGTGSNASETGGEQTNRFVCSPPFPAPRAAPEGPGRGPSLAVGPAAAHRGIRQKQWKNTVGSHGAQGDSQGRARVARDYRANTLGSGEPRKTIKP